MPFIRNFTALNKQDAFILETLTSQEGLKDWSFSV